MGKSNFLLIIILFFVFIIVGISILLYKQKNNIFFDSYIQKPKRKLYSQNNEELIIRHFFNDRRNGIFVDVGCSHYKNLSTTFYLEQYLDWSGIGVDALSEFAEGYHKNRPRTKFFNFIVTDHSGTTEPIYRLVVDPGRSSQDKKSMLRVARKRKIKEQYEVIYVPTITLNELLEKNGISNIDFLSIDIEGNEVAALAGFDIEKFRPQLVCIEVNAPWKIMDYFIRHKYKLIIKYLLYDHINWYFTPRRR